MEGLNLLLIISTMKSRLFITLWIIDCEGIIPGHSSKTITYKNP